MPRVITIVGFIIMVSCYGLIRTITSLSLPPPPTPIQEYPTRTPQPTATPLSIDLWNAPVDIDTPYTCLTWGNTFINIRTGEVLDYANFIANNPITNATPTAIPSATPLPPQEQDIYIDAPNGMFSIYRVNGQVFVDFGGEQRELVDNDSRYYSFPETIQWSSDSRYVLYANIELNQLTLFDTQTGTLRDVGFILHPNNIIGWSPNSQFFTLLNDTTLEIWQVADGIPSLVETSTESVLPHTISWSWDGNQIAYISTTQEARYLNISQVGENNLQLRIWELSNLLFITWSPDNLYIALHYGSGRVININIIATDGNAPPITMGFYDPNLPDGTYTEALWVWGSYGVVTWGIDEEITNYRLYYYDFGDQANAILESGLILPPMVSPDGDRLSLYRRNEDDETYTMEILILDDQLLSDAQQRLPFISGATDMGNAFWSGTGEWVAVTWAEGTTENNNRQVNMAWMRSDGSDYHNLSNNYHDIRDLVWSPDGQELIYIAGRDGEFTIEAVNLNTLETRTISESYPQISNLRYEPEIEELYFNWADAFFTGSARYTVDGTQIDIKTNIVTILNENDPITEAFWSPTFNATAIKIRSTSDGESLLLYNTETDETFTLAENLMGLGNPLWSPDGELFVFSQLSNRRATSLQIATVNGEIIWSLPNFMGNYYMQWIACD